MSFGGSGRPLDGRYRAAMDAGQSAADTGAASAIPDVGDLLASGPPSDRLPVHLIRRPRRRRLILAVLGVLSLTMVATALHLAQPSSTWSHVLSWRSGLALGTVQSARIWGRDAQPMSLAASGAVDIPVHRWLSLSTVREADGVRFTIEAEWPERVDAVELVVRAGTEPPPAWWMVPQGISCQFAGYAGAETSLSIQTEAGAPRRQGLTKVAFEPGRRYRFTLESAAGRARLLVDDRVVMDVPELIPLGGEHCTQVALRAWAPLRLHALQVERQRIPRALSPLQVGDALAAHGQVAAAQAWFRTIAADHQGSELAALALGRAAGCAVLLADGPAQLARIRDQLARLHPGHAVREQVEVLAAVRAWQDGQYGSALDIAEALSRWRPDTQIALRLLAERLGPIPAPHGHRLAVLAARVPGATQFDFSGLALTDLAFLADRPLTDLNLSDNPLSDLTPLHGSRLERLWLTRTGVHEVTALTGMPLTVLSLAETAVDDLTPLAASDLIELDLTASPVVDLSPLAGLPLRILRADRTAVADLTPLAGLPLERLSLARTAIADLAPVAGAPLRSLQLSRTAVTDLTPISAADLRELSIAYTPITSLAALTGAQGLRFLDAEGTSCADISPLTGLPLEHLVLRGCPVADLAPLRGSALKYLIIDGTPVTDVSPLSDVPLQRLSANGTAITTLAPLAAVPLRQLEILDVPVIDLPLLAQLGTLQTLSVGGPCATPGGWERVAEAFSSAGRGAFAQQCRAAAIPDAEAAALVHLALPVGQARRLVLGRPRSYAQAMALAEAAGARLVWPRDGRDLRMIMDQVGIDREVWTSARWRSGRLESPEGTPIPGISVHGWHASDASLPLHLFWGEGARAVALSQVHGPAEKQVVLEW